MAVEGQDMETDPITAALPPNSDYITYLTILEYQLTPNRLPILTKHLAQDDGTLAKEIGWDLVKLVLPLFKAAPNDAAKCLEVVARRGNPREVIVRVAEALETLGADNGDSVSEFDPGEETNELPTFKGEAQRVHLGEMKLQGMPLSTSANPNFSGAADSGEQKDDTSAISDSLDLQFSSLLSMLGLLHSRIKTQYPSRFLATSLPAALGAYRQIAITPETTISFVTLLGKLSGKQRPTLPPRSSTANATQTPSATTAGTEIYAALPDPEGKSEENSKSPSDLEDSIVLRLLQAVALEVLEEYLLADENTMEWATRLFEKQNPSKTVPNRKARFQAWQDDAELRSQDALMDEFLRLSRDLGMDPEGVFRTTNLPMASDQEPEDVIAEEKQEVELSEFPTSPSQIPYSHLGALFLCLASKVPVIVHSDAKALPLDIYTPDLHHFVNQFVVPTPATVNDQLIPSVAHNPPSAIDSLLALLSLTKIPPLSPTSTSGPEADYQSLISILSYLSAEHANPSFRASAHQLATTLLHEHPSPSFRLSVIKSTMTNCGPFDNLKEVAIGWLKEEILATIPPGQAKSQEPSSDEDNLFASPTLFTADDTLCSLLFPDTQATPTTTTDDESQPPPPPTTTLTYPIPALNLLFLLLTNPTLKSRYKDLPTSSTVHNTISSSSSSSSSFAHRALHFATTHQNFVDEHAGEMGSKEEEGKLAMLALAVGRIVGVMEGWQGEEAGKEGADQKGRGEEGQVPDTEAKDKGKGKEDGTGKRETEQ